MTVGPLVLALCLNIESQYEPACRTALEQAAVQTGIEAGLDTTRRKWEKKAIQYINPSMTAQVIGGAAVYIVRFANGQNATFAVPNPTRIGATSMTIGKEEVGVVWRIDF
jgi:hypothetical protein